MHSPDAMPTPETPTAELAAFDPPLADAVAAVLAGAGVPTVLHQVAGGERSVLVPPHRRAEALSTLAERMDEVQALVGAGSPPTPAAGAGASYGADEDEEASRPLVLERFRSFGWVAVALVPLLIIGLANVRLPAGVVVALVVGCAVLLSAWRGGRLGGER